MKTLFFIDDDPFVTNLYQARLTSEGFKVETANSGVEALSKLETLRPDLIVLDLNMPDLNGVDVLKQIRSFPPTSTLPVIIFSNGLIQDLLDEAGPLGVQKVFVKMLCPPNKLIDGIKEVLDEYAPESLSIDALAEAANGKSSADLTVLLTKFAKSKKKDELHELLLEIYKAAWPRIRKGLKEDETTQRGMLSRALQKLIKDLYDNPGNVTQSTKDTVKKGLNKLIQLDSEALGSEMALKNLLKGLD